MFKENSNIDPTTIIPLSNLARGHEVSTYIKRVIDASLYDFHETEALEVSNVLLNVPGNRATVSGTFLVSKKDIENVKPLISNMTYVPVVGEHVVVAEYNGEYYYWPPLNRKGSVNENAIPGAAAPYTEGVKFGETFESRDVPPIVIGEGCIVFEGRFGQTLHFDGHNNKPTSMLTNTRYTGKENFRPERIDVDDSSIYLTSDGLPGNNPFDGQKVEGKKVLIKSNGIFISGEDVRLGSSVETNIEPVVKGTTLKELLDPIFETQISQNETTMVENTAKIAQLAAIQPQTPQTIEEIRVLGESNINLQMMNTKLQTAINSSTYLSETVKTV